MKIGILTFHSQLNYGGVLQCWALKTALEGMGHEVVVVDRWLDEKNEHLEGVLGALKWNVWLSVVLKSLIGCGTWRIALRHLRTRRFVKALGLTPYHFFEWKDAPKDLGVDCLVVGSDQVWHGGDWGDPRPYLLEGAPRVKSISYAASFGMSTIPADQVELYRCGLGRFAALSCRENEGVAICRGLGYSAAHVVDPTLLLEPSHWSQLLPSGLPEPRRSNRRNLTCYFLSQDVKSILPILESWARRSGYHVCVMGYTRPCPKSIAALISHLCKMAKDILRPPRVRICADYGPKEFVRAFADAEAVITDSFHAVMFSSIFSCNCRFLKPTCEMRKTMFARIEEFAEKCIKGNFFTDNVEQALQCFELGETI